VYIWKVGRGDWSLVPHRVAGAFENLFFDAAGMYILEKL